MLITQNIKLFSLYRYIKCLVTRHLCLMYLYVGVCMGGRAVYKYMQGVGVWESMYVKSEIMLGV